jgi:hypothetical protein
MFRLGVPAWFREDRGMELTERQWLILEAGRKAMRETIAASYPGDVVPLVAVAIVGAFAEICRKSSAGPELVQIINSELAEVGLELRHMRRH